MDKKEDYEQAKDTLGYDERKYDDTSEAFKWSKHTDEERERLFECRDRIESYINQLNVEIIEPDYLELIMQIYTSYPPYDDMCICISPQMMKFNGNPKVNYQDNTYLLNKGLQKLCEKLVNQNNNIMSFEEHSRYESHFLLNIKNVR